jgi:hypothetical protein
MAACGMFLALGTSLFPKHIVISVMFLFLAPRFKIFFEKLVAIVPMLGLALETDCAHF